MRHCILAIAAAFLLGVGAAAAAPITFAFSGTIDNDPFGVFGTAAFSASYTFDSATPQVLNTPSSGGYAGSGGIFAISASFTGTIGGTLDGLPFLGDTLNITVNNNFPGPLDEYLVTGTSSVDSALFIELRMDDSAGTAFSNTLLPLAAPSLASFSSSRFDLYLRLRGDRRPRALLGGVVGCCRWNTALVKKALASTGHPDKQCKAREPKRYVKKQEKST
jgi:hypothetical protein